MINPTLTKKTKETLTPDESAKKLFKVIYDEQKNKEELGDEVPRIRVSDLISKMSFYYEKIRNVIEYKEEHLFRKNAIERILKRYIVIEGIVKKSKSHDIAKHLLMELIRAGYLPNNKMPESKIGEVGKVISKYVRLKECCLESFKGNIRARNECANWIIALAASDIEERMDRGKIDQTVVKNMYNILFDIVKFPDDSDYEKDKDIQILAGIHSSFLKFDRDMISFIIFKYYNADWSDADNESIERVGRNINVLREKINKQIDHPLSKQLNRIISRYTVFYTILIDVIDDDPAGVYNSFKSDPKAFPRQIKNKCAARYKSVKSKLWRSALRSIIYIFITKSIFAAILEVPAIKWFGGEINSMSLLINISFPALLLFLIVLFTQLPSKDNTAKIVEGVNEIVFEERSRKEPFQLRQPTKRKGFMSAAFGVIYFVTFFVSFGFVILSLQKIHFSWISIIIFLFFLTLVSFFSIRIRKGTRDLIVVSPKENILSLFSDFFYTPIVAVGKWLSEKFSRINVFVFLFDFIIEAPFKIFIEITEEWTKYVKERKEDII